MQRFFCKVNFGFPPLLVFFFPFLSFPGCVFDSFPLLPLFYFFFSIPFRSFAFALFLFRALVIVYIWLPSRKSGSRGEKGKSWKNG